MTKAPASKRRMLLEVPTTDEQQSVFPPSDRPSDSSTVKKLDAKGRKLFGDTKPLPGLTLLTEG